MEKNKCETNKTETRREYTPEEKRKMNDAFVLSFPTIIIAAIAVYYSSFSFGVIVISLVVFQWVLLKRFVEGYHSK